MEGTKDAPGGLSEQQVIERYRARRRRQFRVFWIGFPAALAWMALSAVTFGMLVASHPGWNSPLLMLALLLPFFAVFGVVAARFTRANLRCPACDGALDLYGWGAWRRSVSCPHCRATLSR